MITNFTTPFPIVEVSANAFFHIKTKGFILSYAQISHYKYNVHVPIEADFLRYVSYKCIVYTNKMYGYI